MNRNLLFFVFVSSMVAGVHCNGSGDDVATTGESSPVSQPTEPGPAGDSTAPPSTTPATPPAAPSGTDEAPAATGCTSLTNNGPVVPHVEVVASNAPAATGGSFTDGTYHLTGVTLYAGPSGKATTVPLAMQNTVKISGGVVEQVLDATKPDGSTTSERTSETFTTSGNTVQYTMTCPSSKTRTATFSATPTSASLFLTNDVGLIVEYKYTR